MGNQIEDVINDIGDIKEAVERKAMTLPNPPEMPEVTTFEKAKAGYKARQAVVAFIISRPGSTQKEIADYVGINTGFVSAIVRDLEKKGLVKRRDRHVYFFNQAVPEGTDEAPRTYNKKPSGIKVAAGEMTTQEYANKHGVIRSYVSQLLKQGILKGRKIKLEGIVCHATGIWLLQDQPWPRDREKYHPRKQPIGNFVPKLSKETKSEKCRKTRIRIPAKKRRALAVKANKARWAKKPGFFSRLFGG